MQWMQLDQNGDANSWPLGEFLALRMRCEP